ncbi:MAG: hypothetical protein DME76_03355 [Verrucomicrobia bacterium]|nr:MAG: hypothetical protein DME76_03355 [Verrucomicrobiota bacterium]
MKKRGLESPLQVPQTRLVSFGTHNETLSVVAMLAGVDSFCAQTLPTRRKIRLSFREVGFEQCSPRR